MKNLWVDIADGVEFSQGVVSDVSRSLSDYGPQPVVKLQPKKTRYHAVFTRIIIDIY